jgi:hypothetical protein
LEVRPIQRVAAQNITPTPNELGRLSSVALRVEGLTVAASRRSFKVIELGEGRPNVPVTVHPQPKAEIDVVICDWE